MLKENLQQTAQDKSRYQRRQCFIEPGKPSLPGHKSKHEFLFEDASLTS